MCAFFLPILRCKFFQFSNSLHSRGGHTSARARVGASRFVAKREKKKIQREGDCFLTDEKRKRMRRGGGGFKSTGALFGANLSLLALLFLSLSLNARLSLKARRQQQRQQEEERNHHHHHHPREERDAFFLAAEGGGRGRGEEEERRNADDASLSLSSSVPFVRYEVYPKCDAGRIERNAKLFRKEPTTCPDEKWYDEWTRGVIGSGVGSFVATEVGCNKGTDAILQLRRFTKEPRASVARFQKLTSFPEFSCSWEKKKWDEAVRGSSSSGDDRGSSKGIKYRHYCIEASYETFERVHAAAEEMKLADIGLTVHYNAVSSSSWPSTVKFPKIAAGQENIGIGMTENPNLRTERYSEFHQTPVITVDDFVRKESIARLDVLKIDTEGNDAAVLIGASMTLLSLKPSYVQFENHGVGKWKTFDLKDSIDMLDAMEYECFWSTNSGKLIQVTNCWHESYGKFKIWSNIACYHRSDRTLKRIMDKYVVAAAE